MAKQVEGFKQGDIVRIKDNKGGVVFGEVYLVAPTYVVCAEIVNNEITSNVIFAYNRNCMKIEPLWR